MKNKTLIIQIITRLYLGGAQRVCLDLSKAVNENDDYEVLIITGNPELLSSDTDGIELITVPSLDRSINPVKDIRAFFSIKKLIELKRTEYRHVIIHTHTTKAGIIGRWAAYCAGVRHIVHTAHGWAFYKGQNAAVRSVYILAEKLTAMITEKIAAVSKAVMTQGLMAGVGSKLQYRVIYNGLDMEIIKPDTDQLYRQFGIEKGKKLIISVACMKHQKNPAAFVRITEKMKKNNEFHFIMAGDGELKPDIEQYIREHQLKNITLLGWYRHVEHLYSIADAIVLTSYFEGMPLVIIEAAKYGIPVIASDIEPHRELLDRNMLCKPDDTHCFAEKLQAGNMHRVKDRFPLRHMTYKYMKLYRDLQNENS